MARHSLDDLKKAANDLGIDLSDEEAKKMIDGSKIDLDQTRIDGSKIDLDQTRVAASPPCEGMKVKDLGRGCGIYYIPPLTISYCCNF